MTYSPNLGRLLQDRRSGRASASNNYAFLGNSPVSRVLYQSGGVRDYPKTDFPKEEPISKNPIDKIIGELRPIDPGQLPKGDPLPPERSAGAQQCKRCKKGGELGLGNISGCTGVLIVPVDEGDVFVIHPGPGTVIGPAIMRDVCKCDRNCRVIIVFNPESVGARIDELRRGTLEDTIKKISPHFACVEILLLPGDGGGKIDPPIGGYICVDKNGKLMHCPPKAPK